MKANQQPYSHRLLLLPCLGLLVFFMSCVKPDSKRAVTHPALAEIDSLLWSQPDSAFMELRRFAESPDVDSLEVFDEHYLQLLLSELLYKNDYAQTNREELLKTVEFFDSVASDDRDGTLSFLDARAHYINGVGYYEADSVVRACQEYLKALEIMEGRFEEKELVGRKAQFVVYNYNRLMELFSAQFMMEPAIFCGQQALSYCQKELVLFQEIPSICLYIGLQYDKLEDFHTAQSYYEKAINGINDTLSKKYRDVLALKTLCDYQIGLDLEKSIIVLRQLLANACDNKEQSSRRLTIGALYAEEGVYDSALFYLEPVFNDRDNEKNQIQAANCLRVVYDSLDCRDLSNECARFVASHVISEGENKALVLKLEKLYQDYHQKTIDKANQERKKTMAKAILIMAILIVSVFTILIVKTKIKQKKEIIEKDLRFNQMQSKFQRTLEDAERRIQQQKNANSLIATTNNNPFEDEPICQFIMEKVSKGNFKSQMNCSVYKSYALKKNELLSLKETVNRHFNNFTLRLKKRYPKLTKLDVDYCTFYLLGLSDADISALMQRAYNTVNERNNKIKKILNTDQNLSFALLEFAKETEST